MSGDNQEIEVIADAICEGMASWLPVPLHKMAYEDAARWALTAIKHRDGASHEIRPNPGAQVVRGRCENTDEVVGRGFLHVEQMDSKCFWARLDLPDGKAIVMWFNSKSPIKLIAELD